MSYCRFQNTYADLRDCQKALRNLDDDLSSDEADFAKRLVQLCAEIAGDYSGDGMKAHEYAGARAQPRRRGVRRLEDRPARRG